MPGTGGEAGAPRPHILLAIADDVSYPHMGAYGTTWVRTPAFDRVAREGLLFANAYTPNAKCSPSRACILTGRNPWQLKDACNHIPFFPAEFKTYAEALAEHGYAVGKTGKGWAPGVARDAAGKARQMAGKPFEARKAKPPARGIADNDYAANFADFLDQVPAGSPWCFWYGGYEPHRGYEYGSGISAGGKKLDDIDRVPAFFPDGETTRNDLLDYAFEIEYFDLHLARMLALLAERGAMDDTLVVATADNGMPFPRVKGQAYELSNHMPLAVMWKRGIKNPGRIIADYVSFIDLAPTFIELAGLSWDAAGMQPSPGRSLTELFRAEAAGVVDASRDHVLLGKERHDVGRPHDWGYPIRGIVENGMLYLRNFEIARWPAGNPETGYLNCDGSPTKTAILQGRTVSAAARFWQLAFGKRVAEELYDVRADPDCMTNLAASETHRERKAALERRLMEELRRQGDPRALGDGGLFERYPYASDAERGFYERHMRGEKIKAGWVNPSDFEHPGTVTDFRGNR